MNITATCEQGTITLPYPVVLKHDRVTVQVVIPDEEILQAPVPSTPAQPSQRLDSLFRDLDAIRGGTGIEDDGLSDNQKLARAVAEDPRYRD